MDDHWAFSLLACHCTCVENWLAQESITISRYRIATCLRLVGDPNDIRYSSPPGPSAFLAGSRSSSSSGMLSSDLHVAEGCVPFMQERHSCM